MEKGKLIVFSGPSGVGKNTIRERLFKDESLKLKFSISHTTRGARTGEENCVDYFFISKEEFAQKINNDELIEHATFVNNHYGTCKEQVQEVLASGMNCLLEIEVQGALQVMKKMPEALTIFVAPPSLDTLEARLRERGTETEAVITKRLEQAKFEMTISEKYQHVVINEDIDKCVKEIADIIRSA